MPAEQFSAERLIERTWQDFNRKTLSFGAIFILWGGFESAEELTHRYFFAKDQKHLLDRRRRLSEQEYERVEYVKALAQQVVEYRNWARGEAGDPMLRDALVGYCAAFENALKSTALAFRVAAHCEGNVGAALLSAEKLTQLRREIRRCWEMHAKSSRGPSESTAECFYINEVFERNPCPERWLFKPPGDEGSPKLLAYKISSKDYWPDVAEAFRLRNRVVHQNGYLDEQLEIAEEVMHAGAEVLLTVKVVGRVRDAFASLLDPINPESM